jgi:2-polyprenyl-3-methyl-5-hydroxy-6-metoxy-1,4-benzoquinol methylase
MNSRYGVIRDAVSGRSVLDVGSASDGHMRRLWHMINDHATEVLGVDTRPCDDPNIVIGDIQTIKLHRKFDIAIVGDVIEHVENQGLLLGNIREHLHENGRLILTTPNAKWWTVLYKPHPEHVLWHDRYTLKLVLERSGFTVDSIGYYPGNKPDRSFLSRVVHARQGLLAICHLM